MRVFISVFMIWGLVSCGHSNKAVLPYANDVDLERFMGDWFVIANIPTFIENDAHNAIERYSMNDDGTIATTFTFNDGSFDGDIKIYNPTGYVSDDTNSLWGMQFIWPFKAEFVIAYLSPDYQYTIIARSARDYVWIMARSPVVSDIEYEKLVNLCVEMGYVREKIIKVPHQMNMKSHAGDVL